MSACVQIRLAGSTDAEAMSRVIVAALHATNAADYPPEVIKAVAASFTPEHVRSRFATRTVFVATQGGSIIGTASLNGDVVRSVFVSPDAQGKGVGAALMEAVERLAAAQGLTALCVPSSVTAQGFYEKRGFVAVQDQFHGAERTIVMTRLPIDETRHRSSQ